MPGIMLQRGISQTAVRWGGPVKNLLSSPSELRSFPESRSWRPWRPCSAEALGATRGQQRPALARTAMSPVDCRLWAAVLTQNLNCQWPRIARGCSSRGYSFPGFRKPLTSSLSFHNPAAHRALFPSSSNRFYLGR